MGFDTSIFRQQRVQPLQPMNALMQGLQVQGAMQGNALQQVQRQYYEQQKALELRKAQEEAAQRTTRNALLQGLRPVAPADAITAAGVKGPRPEALPFIGQRPKIDAAQLIAAGVPQATIEFLANAGTLGMPEVARTIDGTGPDGSPTTQQRDKFGRLVGDAIPKAVERTMTDLGGQVVPVNRYTQTTPLKKTQTPESIASNATTVRGQNMTDARAREFNGIQRALITQQQELKVDELKDKASERDKAKVAGIASIENQLGVIDKALTHPGKSAATGLSSVLDPRNIIPGTDPRNFRAVLDQIKGSAFLQAFQSLKGGGAITEIEGKKAESAIARLDTAQSDDEFDIALQDLRDVMAAGYQRAAGKPYKPPVPRPLGTPADPNASAMQLFDAADAIIGGK